MIKFKGEHLEKAKINIGVAYNRVGKAQESLEVLLSIINENMDDEIVVSALANTYLNLKMYDKSELFYVKLLEITSSKNADAWNNLGVVKYWKNDFKAAKECFKKAYELNPNHPDAGKNYEAFKNY